MNRKAEAEAAPAQAGCTITRHKGGTGEKQIKLSQVVIPDLWPIAQAEMDLGCRHAILDCWHLAHDLKREVEERADANTALIEALRMIADDTIKVSPVRYREIARSAIAQVEKEVA